MLEKNFISQTILEKLSNEMKEIKTPTALENWTFADFGQFQTRQNTTAGNIEEETQTQSFLEEQTFCSKATNCIPTEGKK